MTTRLFEIGKVKDSISAPEISQLVGATVRITSDPCLTSNDRLYQVLEASAHDRQLLGRAWLHVAVESARHPSRVASEAEALLRDALEVEGAESAEGICRAAG